MQEQLRELCPGWQIVRKIGSGNYGSVYEIQRDLFGRIEKAALKVISIPQHQGEVDELFGHGFDSDSIIEHYRGHLAKIVQEYSIMAQVKGNSNIVCCDDVMISEHKTGIGWTILIRMELLTPLLQSLDMVCNEEQVIRLGMDICQALIVCHSKGIVHRDVKPQNLFVSKDGNFKLGDFGVAKTIDQIMSGTRIGTYSYMAPEVYHDRPYGIGADIYSLGLVMYWLLNDHRLPFLPEAPQLPSIEDNERARLRRFSGEILPAPKHGNKALVAVIRKACAFDPEKRYKTPQEFLQALKDLPAREDVPGSSIAGRVSTRRTKKAADQRFREDRHKNDGKKDPGETLTLLLPMFQKASDLTGATKDPGAVVSPEPQHPDHGRSRPPAQTFGEEAPAPSGERGTRSHTGRTFGWGVLVVALLLLVMAATVAASFFGKGGSTSQSPDTGTTVPSAGPHMQIPADALQYDGHCYMLYDDDTIGSWEEAYVFCESMGGYLAVIGSQEENDILFDYVQSLGHSQVFFGFSDRIQEGSWMWVPQETSDFTNWLVGQPNDSWASDYAQFLYPYKGSTAVRGGWSDAEFGDTNGHAFLCEWAACAPATTN